MEASWYRPRAEKNCASSSAARIESTWLGGTRLATGSERSSGAGPDPSDGRALAARSGATCSPESRLNCGSGASGAAAGGGTARLGDAADAADAADADAADAADAPGAAAPGITVT